MSKFTKGLSVVGMVVAGAGLILGTVTNDDSVFQSGMLLGIMMMCLVTTNTVLDIKNTIEKGMENNGTK